MATHAHPMGRSSNDRRPIAAGSLAGLVSTITLPEKPDLAGMTGEKFARIASPRQQVRDYNSGPGRQQLFSQKIRENQGQKGEKVAS